ncbi:winged helix DNA-binding domain-containing protein [Larkinella soli]|uniref:winged helix DNA-binding domain-containing protein n=1 Tax=Larkinella soli TaxID=1770527 RepID=UPI000FFC27AF|nr:winged helix DNA-binding domain-containing protein [Larkinella soli]
MTVSDLLAFRLHSQHLARPRFRTPGEVVSWFGAMQAQDYLGALWAVGHRIPGMTEAAVEQALADRTVVRTWPMRGTLHFLAPQDLRWMLDLLATRVVLKNRNLYRKAGLEEAALNKSREVLISALEGGRQCTRPELYDLLHRAGIPTDGNQGLHILGILAQQGLICFGPRRGKQPTFVLLEEWVPPARPLDRDEAVAELTRRYFTSHGPASVHDFAWWSGLTQAEIKTGLELNTGGLERVVVEGVTYWMPKDRPDPDLQTGEVCLLPSFDEYLVAYKDRIAPLGTVDQKRIVASANGIFSPVIVVEGRVAGLWRRTIRKNDVCLEPSLFRALDDAERRGLAGAVRRYQEFVGLPVVVTTGEEAG